jgi:hypothetical protein
VNRRLEVGSWHVEVDAESTRRFYAGAGIGSPDRCVCSSCRNFAAAREDIYPVEFKRLLDQLGVDARVEKEVSEYGPADDGAWWSDYENERGNWQDWVWLYIGEFHVCGTFSPPPPPPPPSGPPMDAIRAQKFVRKEKRAAWLKRLRLSRGRAPTEQPAILAEPKWPGEKLGTGFSYWLWRPADSPPDDRPSFDVCFQAAVPWVLSTPPWDAGLVPDT